MLDLDELEPIELLRLQFNATAELKRRKIVRTNNNPLGDYTEWLVANMMDLELTPNSKAGCDAISNEGLFSELKRQLHSHHGLNEHRKLRFIKDFLGSKSLK